MWAYYYIGTLSQTLSFHAPFRPSCICRGKYPAPGRASDDAFLQAFHRLRPDHCPPVPAASDDACQFLVKFTASWWIKQLFPTNFYGISTALTSFSARSTKASPSGREDRAAGSPASPFSRMLCTIGICPRSGTPYFSAILRPPSLPKI